MQKGYFVIMRSLKSVDELYLKNSIFMKILGFI